MYYPKSQIKTDLYTNGDTYKLLTTQELYTGYYYEISDGSKFTGRTPQDGPNIQIVDITPYPQELTFPSNSTLPISTPTLNPSYKIPPSPERLIPPSNPTLPTPQDQSLGSFTRYFCKKTNELKYIEINKQTYNQLKVRDPKIAWDLYVPLEMNWTIKGTKEQVFKANKTSVNLLEQRQKWYGFSQYLKEDYLKYYLES
jgi:hypothetical protein